MSQNVASSRFVSLNFYFINIRSCIRFELLQLGGTIGDIEGMPFVEAFRQFQFRVNRENFVCVHVSLIPQVRLLTSQIMLNVDITVSKIINVFVVV